MATNLALDQELLDHAFRVSGEPTKKAAVTRALQEFIARREQRRVAELVPIQGSGQAKIARGH